MYKRSKRSDTRSIKERDSLLSNIRRGRVVETVSGGQQEAEEQEETSVCFVAESEDLNLITDVCAFHFLKTQNFSPASHSCLI